MNERTCGPMFMEALEAAKKATTDPLELFSWGHLTGQAEKVYLGACYAAMFRPGTTERDRFVERLRAICEIYGLSYMALGTKRGVEFWIHRVGYLHRVGRLKDLTEDSPEAHALRGFLCGVPADEIDRQFHERYAS